MTDRASSRVRVRRTRGVVGWHKGRVMHSWSKSASFENLAARYSAEWGVSLGVGECVACGRTSGVPNRAHIVPKHHGGSCRPENIFVMCVSCHVHSEGRPADQIRLWARSCATTGKLQMPPWLPDILRAKSPKSVSVWLTDDEYFRIAQSAWVVSDRHPDHAGCGDTLRRAL